MEHHTHPSYDVEGDFMRHLHDLALIKLNQSIRTDAEKSICLPEGSTALDPNLTEYGMIAGFGGSVSKVLRLGYVKLEYARIENIGAEFIYTSKLDEIRKCKVSHFYFYSQAFPNNICS